MADRLLTLLEAVLTCLLADTIFFVFSLSTDVFRILLSVQGGAIIFIDELDAIGTKRFGGEQSGDREVQRTMLELLNQLDGFSSNDKIKVPQCRLQH